MNLRQTGVFTDFTIRITDLGEKGSNNIIESSIPAHKFVLYSDSFFATTLFSLFGGVSSAVYLYSTHLQMTILVDWIYRYCLTPEYQPIAKLDNIDSVSATDLIIIACFLLENQEKGIHRFVVPILTHVRDVLRKGGNQPDISKCIGRLHKSTVDKNVNDLAAEIIKLTEIQYIGSLKLEDIYIELSEQHSDVYMNLLIERMIILVMSSQVENTADKLAILNRYISLYPSLEFFPSSERLEELIKQQTTMCNIFTMFLLHNGIKLTSPMFVKREIVEEKLDSKTEKKEPIKEFNSKHYRVIISSDTSITIYTKKKKSFMIAKMKSCGDLVEITKIIPCLSKILCVSKKEVRPANCYSVKFETQKARDIAINKLI